MAPLPGCPPSTHCPRHGSQSPEGLLVLGARGGDWGGLVESPAFAINPDSVQSNCIPAVTQVTALICLS